MAYLDKKFSTLIKFLDSEEGKQSIDLFVKKHNWKGYVEDLWADKVNAVVDFDGLIGAILTKYGSEKYENRWYRRHMEPPQPLLWTLFRCASVHGRECAGWEWAKYSNHFTHELFFYKGYYFNNMIGQGSFIKVEKAD